MSTENNTPPAPYSPERVLDMRQAWESAWPNTAELRKIDPQSPNYEADKAAHMAEFDASMKAQGVAEIPQPPDLELRRIHETHLVADQNTKPEDYQVNFAAPEHMNAESLAQGRAFAHGLKLPTSLGGTIVSRISEIDAKLTAANMGEKQLEQHVKDQHEALIRHFGSEEKAEAARAKVMKVLDLVKDNPLTTFLRSHPAILDPIIFVPLSQHADRLESLAAALAKRKPKS